MTRTAEPNAVPVRSWSACSMSSLGPSLLAQRPDLSSSVAGLRSLNAQVGVAEAAFYPSLSLTGNYGFASERLRALTGDASQQFSVGPLALPAQVMFSLTCALSSPFFLSVAVSV